MTQRIKETLYILSFFIIFMIALLSYVLISGSKEKIPGYLLLGSVYVFVFHVSYYFVSELAKSIRSFLYKILIAFVNSAICFSYVLFEVISKESYRMFDEIKAPAFVIIELLLFSYIATKIPFCKNKKREKNKKSDKTLFVLFGFVLLFSHNIHADYNTHRGGEGREAFVDDGISSPVIMQHLETVAISNPGLNISQPVINYNTNAYIYSI